MTNDEMQSAIEFLLKNQANFEVQLEKTNRQIEQTERQMEKTEQQMEKTERQIEQTQLQLEQTQLQLEQTDLLVSSLADTQARFIQTVTRHVESQGEINTRMQRRMSELTKAQKRTEQGISDLTKLVGDLTKAVFKNDGSPPA